MDGVADDACAKLGEGGGTFSLWRGVPMARITVFGGSILGSPCWGKLRVVRVWEVYRKSLAVRANGLKRSGCELLGFDCFPVIVLQ